MTARRLDPTLRHKPFCDGDAPTFRWKNGTAGWAEECDRCGAYAVARPFWASGITDDGPADALPMLNATPTTRTATDVGLKVWRFNHRTGEYEIKGEMTHG